jgi:PEP-CTERM motif-containing protein
MLYRGFAVLGLLAVSPAHATLIEYSFSSTIAGYGGTVGADFGVETGDSIKGGFVFDDAAVQIAYTEDEIVGYDGWASGVATGSTYDMSALRLWADVGDKTVTATGDELFIGDAPTLVYHPDTWRLAMRGDGRAVSGYVVDGIQIFLQEWFCGPLLGSGLQVSDAGEWGYGGYGSFNRWFDISFEDGSFINGQMNWIKPKSVPEPASLSLLALGALGAFTARRRKQAVDAQ